MPKPVQRSIQLEEVLMELLTNALEKKKADHTKGPAPSKPQQPPKVEPTRTKR